jgi:hypothetical protein
VRHCYPLLSLSVAPSATPHAHPQCSQSEMKNTTSMWANHRQINIFVENNQTQPILLHLCIHNANNIVYASNMNLPSL